MSNTRSFSDFDSPDGSTALGGAKEAGVLLTDTLEDLREKTNGIVEKVKAVDAELQVTNGNLTTVQTELQTDFGDLTKTSAQQFSATISSAIKRSTVAAGDAAFAIDLNASNVHIITLSTSRSTDLTLSLSDGGHNPASDLDGATYTFIIKNESIHDIDFPANMFFAGGDPDTTTGADGAPGVDIISGIYDQVADKFYAAITYDIETS